MQGEHFCCFETGLAENERSSAELIQKMAEIRLNLAESLGRENQLIKKTNFGLEIIIKKVILNGIGGKNAKIGGINSKVRGNKLQTRGINPAIGGNTHQIGGIINKDHLTRRRSLSQILLFQKDLFNIIKHQVCSQYAAGSIPNRIAHLVNFTFLSYFKVFE